MPIAMEELKAGQANPVSGCKWCLRLQMVPGTEDSSTEDPKAAVRRTFGPRKLVIRGIAGGWRYAS